uniref:Uncharacterized protein n=1 Tax=Panagrolaimus sp. PS1159 TaxID=55785 RepID=A0AC35FW64_9BILA
MSSSSSSSTSDRGRLPSDEEQDLYRVPNNAAGSGYVPLTSMGGQDRWLDGISLRVGDCILYQGDACRNFLNGKHIMITSESREALYDIDRELRAAMMFIQHIPDLSNDCKRYSHAVACYHMYKVCDQSAPSTSASIAASNKVISLCRKDCDSLKDEVCPKGFSMAAQHELVGDGPKALLPHCTSLSENAGRCLRVLEPVQPPPPLHPKDKGTAAPHWCYVDSGKKYEGSFSEAISGRRCLPWSQVDDDQFNTENYPILSKSKNYCRNPGGSMNGPWCFTSPNGQKELCEIPHCPKNMYPEFSDNAPISTNSGVLDAINNKWNDMPSQMQLASMAGLGGLAVLLLVLLFCCCCRRRKSSSSTSSSVKKGSGFGGGVQSCNGSSIVTSGMNSNYGRKYQNQGMPGGHLQPHAYEMNALLPNSIPPSSQNTGYGMQGGSGYIIPPHQQQQQQQQYSPPTTEPPIEPFQIRSIAPHQLKFDKILGEGTFTSAYVGEYHTDRGLAIPVVIKALKQGSSQIESQIFEDEIRSIAAFNHQNVIQLLGISYIDNNYCSAVFDYNCHGDLHEFLKVREPLNPEADEKEKIRNFEDFFRIGGQIAAGMEFLARMGHVHRDLATRNCLVGDQQIIRICDFASMRPDYDSDYYMLSSRSRVPLRWLSKEALEESRYTTASDVYAFGVTLWELYTFGRQPFETFSDGQVINLISNHEPLPCPPGCPSNVYRTMVECWNEVPERRPNFSELYSKFQKWCINGPQIFMNSNRANSTHSGSSGNNRQQSSSSQSLQRSSNHQHHHHQNPYIPDPYQVPPPAPLMHSTPIGRS